MRATIQAGRAHRQSAGRHSRQMAPAAVQALLGNAIDYAGLFAPASLSMHEAVRKYATYLGGSRNWALGRFIVPISRLQEFIAVRAAVGSEPIWRLSALEMGIDVEDDIEQVLTFNRAHAQLASIETLELKPTTVESLASSSSPEASAGTPNLFGLPLPNTARDSGTRLKLVCEVGLEENLPELLPSIARAGARAKVRTGGVTEEAFPEPAVLARFLDQCQAAGVVFKATAGLHHALRGEYPLTYEDGSAATTMHGFLNLLLAAGFAHAGWNAAQLIPVLDERSAAAFQLEAGGWSWRGHHLPLETLQSMRSGFLLSFGSCSFEEPIAEMQSLGWLPA